MYNKIIILPLIAALYLFNGIAADAEVPKRNWSGLSEALLTELASGAEITEPISMKGPVNFLLDEIGHLNLEYGSADLPAACTSFNALRRDVGANIENIHAALKKRSGLDGDYFWYSLADNEPDFLIQVAMQLQKLATFESYIESIDQAICQNRQEPEFEVRGISQTGTGSLAAFMIAESEESRSGYLTAWSQFIEGIDSNVFDAGYLEVISDDIPVRKPISPPGIVVVEQTRWDFFEHTTSSLYLQSPRRLSIRTGEWIKGDARAEQFDRVARYISGIGEDDTDELEAALTLLKSASKERDASFGIFGLAAPQFEIDISETELKHFSLSSSHVDGVDVENSTLSSLEMRGVAIGPSGIQASNIHANKIVLSDIISSDLWGASVSFNGAKANSLNIDRMRSGYRTDSLSTLIVDAELLENTTDIGELTEGQLFEFVGFDVYLHGAQLGEAFFLDNRLHAVFGQGVEFGRIVEFEDTFIFDNIYLPDFVAKTVTLNNVTTAERIFPDEIKNRQNLIFSNARVSGSFNAWDTTTKFLGLEGLQAAKINVSGGQYGQIYFRGARIVSGFIKPLSARDIYGPYSNFSALEIVSADHGSPIDAERISLLASHVDRIWMYGIHADQIELNGLNVGSLEMQCIQSVTIDAAVVEAYNFAMFKFQSEEAHFSSASVKKLWLSSNASCPEQIATSDKVEKLFLEDLTANSVAIGVQVKEMLTANRAIVDNFAFITGDFEFSQDSIVSFRKAKIGTVAFPMKSMSQTRLEMEGAQIDNMRIFDPIWDGSGLCEGGFTEPCKLVTDAKNLPAVAKADYEMFVSDELLPALSLTREMRNPLHYRAEEYNFLRRSLSEAGYPKLADDVAILQNDHYAANMASNGVFGEISSVVYRFAGSISNFGYDTGKGIVVLLGVWFFGVGVLLLERLVLFPTKWFAERMAVFDTRYLERYNNLGEVRENLPPLFPEALFLSVDRTVPTLAVDENFSRPVEQNNSIYVRSKWVVSALYIQRIMGFLTVVVLIGGALDIFQ